MLVINASDASPSATVCRAPIAARVAPMAVLAAEVAEQVIAQAQGSDGGRGAHHHRGGGEAVEAVIREVLDLIGAKIPALGEVAQQVVVVGEVLERGGGRGADAGEPAALGVEAAAEGGRAAQLLGDLAAGVLAGDLLVDLRRRGGVVHAIGMAAHVPGALHGAAAGVGFPVGAAQGVVLVAHPRRAAASDQFLRDAHALDEASEAPALIDANTRAGLFSALQVCLSAADDRIHRAYRMARKGVEDTP